MPMGEEDKELFYQWATASDATPFWYGELYGDKIPDRNEFFEDWKDFYFNDTAMLKGRCFKIISIETGSAIGQINYQKTEEVPIFYDLDIIIANDADKNKGYGSEALQLLTGYIHTRYGIKCFCIYALAENVRAVRAYLKAGFEIASKYMDERNSEWVRMILIKNQ